MCGNILNAFYLVKHKMEVKERVQLNFVQMLWLNTTDVFFLHKLNKTLTSLTLWDTPHTAW